MQVEPEFTHLLAADWLKKAQTPKPTRRGTPLRYSAAHSCKRQMAYNHFDAEPSNPMDEAGAWVTGLGTALHELVQDAIGKQYVAEFEVPSEHLMDAPDGVGALNYVSGSADALIDMGHDEDGSDTDRYVLWELKTMGTYGFDKQVGIDRMKTQLRDGEGPALKAIAQVGMNALGIERERGIRISRVILGSLCLEAVSKQKADRLDIEGYDRFVAEFEIPRGVWEPLAEVELDRMRLIAEQISFGYLPDREAVGDDGYEVVLNSERQQPPWQCQYCPHLDLCRADGPGQLWINQSNLTKRSVEV